MPKPSDADRKHDIENTRLFVSGEIYKTINTVVNQAVSDAYNNNGTAAPEKINFNKASASTRLLILKNLNFDNLLNNIYAEIRRFSPKIRLEIIKTYIETYDRQVVLSFPAQAAIKVALWALNHPDSIRKNMDLLFDKQVDTAIRAQRVLDILNATPLAKADIEQHHTESMEQRSRAASEKSDAATSRSAAKTTASRLPKFASGLKATLSKFTGSATKSKEKLTAAKQEHKTALEQSLAEAEQLHTTTVKDLRKLASATKHNLPAGAKFANDAKQINGVISELNSERSSELRPAALINMTTEVITIGNKIASEEPATKSHNSFAANFKYLANKLLESLGKLLEALVALKNTVIQALGLGSKKDLLFSSKEQPNEQQQLQTVKELQNSMRRSQV